MEICDLHFGYRPVADVIRGISATLDTGAITMLIGPNAAGKSTLLKLMLGQLTPRQGQVTWQQHDVAKMQPHERAACIAYVPQRPLANVAFTVEQVVALGRFALRPDANAIEQALDRCDLISQRDRVFSELSTGQQQRVALARAIAQTTGHSADVPRFMLLDEPVSAMDLWHVHHTMTLLAELAKQGLGILMVAHDLNLAAKHAQHIWLMEDGRFAAAGSWEQVLTPAVLEPVYRVPLKMMREENADRPMFFVADGGRLVGTQS